MKKLLPIFILLLAVGVSAQKKKPVAKPTPKPTTIEAITLDGKRVILKSDKTWDYAVEKPKRFDYIPLSPRTKPPSLPIKVPFVEDDLAQLASFFKTIENSFQKSEFETEKEFLSRITSLAKSTNFNNKPLSETTFLLNLPISYNAESKEFRIFSVDRLLVNTQKSEQAAYIIEIVRLSGDRFYQYFISLSLPMPAEKAQMIKKDLKVAVYGFPVGVRDSAGVRPVEFYPLKYIFFNGETGDTYRIIDAQKDNPLNITISR